ncbi:MAG TPA: hypothetical protein VG371_15515 [Solirubrobacteraceae bacterium]|jgi:hypothetical protein|nr:hypothetical protein [Solirubrobacteraceae bacterium]
MVSISKRVAGLGAAVAMFAAAGPIAAASASTVPTAAPAAIVYPAGPVGAAYQAGVDAAVGGLNAGSVAAVGGWNAGATALGLPFQFTTTSVGPLGLQIPGLAPLTATP